MKRPMTARQAALALLGVFVALLVAVHGMPTAWSGPRVPGTSQVIQNVVKDTPPPTGSWAASG
jgi:hypothetical protein